MEAQLRAALLDWLRADASLMAEVNVIEEEQVERATAPWLALVASASADWGSKTHAGREVRVAFELRIHGDDASTGADLASAIDTCVLALPKDQSGFSVMSANFLRGRAERRARNARAHLREYRFRLLTSV